MASVERTTSLYFFYGGVRVTGHSPGLLAGHRGNCKFTLFRIGRIGRKACQALFDRGAGVGGKRNKDPGSLSLGSHKLGNTLFFSGSPAARPHRLITLPRTRSTQRSGGQHKAGRR